MNEPLDLAALAACVGEKFRLELPTGGEVDVELVEAKALPAHQGAPRSEPFSLLFRAPADYPLAQGLRSLRHERLGTLNIFLVPVGADTEGVSLEAVFN